MMKKLMIIGCSALLALSFSVANADTLKAEVNGMVCAFCAQGIDKKLRALPQAKDVYVDLKRKIVAVEIKDQQTLAPEVVKAVVKDAGYDVVDISHVDETIQQIKLKTAKE